MIDALIKYNREIFKCIGYDDRSFLLFVGGTSLEYVGWGLMERNIPTSKDWVSCVEVSNYLDKPAWWIPKEAGEFLSPSPLQNLYE